MIGSSADEVEYWRAEAHKLATILMSEYTWVHEYKISEVDEALKPYIGTSDQKQRQNGSLNATETANPIDHSDLVTELRNRACPAGLPWTGDHPQEDHGHTDCWLHHQAADEIERLRSKLAQLESETDDLRRDLPA